MKLTLYKVIIHLCYEQNGFTGRINGYELVYANSPENAEKAAKRRALENLKKQGYQVVFLNMEKPVKMSKD